MIQLSTDSAQKLFQEFVEHPQLTWDHINTGCESRADFMAEVAAEKGLEPSKIWIEISPGSEGTFGIYLNEARTEMAFFEYHVAVVLDVGDEDITNAMIFDPAFFDAPVTRDAWVERLSGRSEEYGCQVEISVTDWRNFYAPVQMIYAREKALKKRTELLALSKNHDNPTVWTGVCSLARGKWVDTLLRDDRQSFDELRDICLNQYFEIWFKQSEKSTDLKRWLQDNPCYFGLRSDRLLETINFSSTLAALEVRKQYWRYVRDLFQLLTRRRDDLLNGSGESPDQDLSLRFQLFWGSDADDRAESSAEWYSAASHELWDRFGVDYKAVEIADQGLQAGTRNQ